jgi:cytoskeleton protein RodZ
MSVGTELKEARESRKITLEEVSKRTKIPTKYLEAIEEGHFDVFPSQTYAKGFIRAYAKVVGVDPQVLTRQFNAEVQPEEVKVVPKNAEAEMEKTLGWRPTLDRPPVFRRQDTEADLNLEIVDEGYSEGTVLHEPSVMRRKALNFKKIRLGKRAGHGALALALAAFAGLGLYYGGKLISHIKWGGPKVEAKQDDSKPFEMVKVADKYQHLILKGLDKSWVQVTMDDGESSSEADMDQGEVKSYKAVKNFKLKLGNAGGVDVQFNGKPLGILGATGQVVEIELPPGPGQAAPGDSNNDNS